MEIKSYSGKYIQVTEEVIDGQTWERCYLKHGVIVYPIAEDGKMYLITEKRPHEIPNVRLKFVAGHLEDDLSPIENANKELQEEIGLKSLDLKEFFRIDSTGTVNNSVHFVLAKNLIPSKIPNPDGDVILSIEKFSIDEIFNKIMANEIRWSSSVLGFFKLYHEKLI